MNLPNQITVARLILAVMFCALLADYDHRAGPPWRIDLAAGLFIIAALSDVLDGYLARRNNQVTSFGRVFDPFVDKFLVCSGFVLLAGRNFSDAGGVADSGVQAWMVVIIVGREMLVTSLRSASEATGTQYAATLHGKIKMLVQSITIPWVLLSLTHLNGPWWRASRTVMIWLTVVVTALSAISYIASARHVLRERARA